MARILVVEDDLQLRQGIEELLQDAGYEVAVTGDVLSAGKLRGTVQKADKEFDLYLLDIMLGRGSGFRLCQDIREKEDTPIIFLSALDDEEHVIEGLNLGADDYIAKPFRRRELLARVSAHLRRTGRKDERSVMDSSAMWTSGRSRYNYIMKAFHQLGVPLKPFRRLGLRNGFMEVLYLLLSIPLLCLVWTVYLHSDYTDDVVGYTSIFFHKTIYEMTEQKYIFFALLDQINLVWVGMYLLVISVFLVIMHVRKMHL